MPPRNEGYLGNNNLKRNGVQIEFTPDMIAEILKCKQDPIYFAEKYIKIVHVDHGLIPIKLYDYQKDIIQSITDNRRVTVCTSRQAGKTTTAVAIILHYVLFNEHKTVALLANKGDSAREILDRIQIAFEALPKWLQQGVVEWNKGSIELENGCKVIATATSSSAIRGKSCVAYDTRVCIEENGSIFFVEIGKTINKRSFIEVEESMTEKLYTVYKTTNNINGKEYVGFHGIPKGEIPLDFSSSGSVFSDGYLGSGRIIRQAVEKYGPHNFSQEILFVSDSIEDAEKFEATVVNAEYTLREDTYNIALGGNVRTTVGENNPFYGRKHSKETISKMQESRKKTLEIYGFSPFKIKRVSDGKEYRNYGEVYKDFDVSDRFGIYSLVRNGELKYDSDFLQERALDTLKAHEEWVSERPLRLERKRELVSKRFSGLKKTPESNEKRSRSIKRWIEENPEAHTNRMEKINKNPDKIRKTAEKHRGMKRSEESRKRMSESSRGQVSATAGKFIVHSISTGKIEYLENGCPVPDGYRIGWPPGGQKPGPKGKKAHFNPNSGEIKFFSIGEAPDGWRLGRK